MIQLADVIGRTEALLKKEGSAIHSRQIHALAQALVEEINAALFKPICFGDTMQGVEDSMAKTFAQESELSIPNIPFT